MLSLRRGCRIDHRVLQLTPDAPLNDGHTIDRGRNCSWLANVCSELNESQLTQLGNNQAVLSVVMQRDHRIHS